jgi:tetratricopeptide (TPR) repeat protein
MKKFNYVIFTFIILLFFGCKGSDQSKKDIEKDLIYSDDPPNKMLNNAYKLFQEGNDKESIELANKVLDIGKKTNNDTLVGKALTSLCRNSQRKLDTIRLAELSEELINLSISSGDKQWVMYQAHMNAEMWRLIGNMDKAESYYNQSMEISNEIGAKGMYMIDHFNKSFVATSKGNFNLARDLIKKYYELRKLMKRNPEDAYGLIALAYLLEKEGNYEGAIEVSTVIRRLFKEQNVFPEPPDEKPLLFVEKSTDKKVDKISRDEIIERSYNESVNSLLNKYLL